MNAGADLPFFAHDGEMASLIRRLDWSKTPIGPIDKWSPTLRMMVSFLLANRFPLLLWWGPDYIQIYNDAYRPITGAKHPDRALGVPVRECWSEIWSTLGPLIDTPFNGGPPTWNEDIALEINRHGYFEETHFTIAYSPVPDETAPRGIGGVLATVHEITEKVVGQRRVELLRDLGAAATECKSADEACSIAAAILERHPKDIPFALLYLLDDDRKQARLAAAAGVKAGGAATPSVANLNEAKGGVRWPMIEAVSSETMQVVENLDAAFPSLSAGPWAEPPHTAVVLPVPSNKAHQPAGLLVVGISSRLRLDESYRSFLSLLTTQMATAIANARAYEEERKRAEALAEIDRAKTAFFSNVSHEFRTPLTLMMSPLEEALAEPAKLTEADRSRLEVAHRNALRLLKLVNTLLDFSRIEAGRIDASYAPVDLAALTAELASVFRSAIERTGMKLVIDCPPLSEPVYVDRDMWEKIALNLLSNAFKFTFEGQIAVELRQTGSGAQLTISDTGTGIPAEEIPRLFERFHRVKNARGRSFEGSGIGLALVQELVRLHGGIVRAESEFGKGSRFIVAIPFGKSHLPADRIAAEQAAPFGMHWQAYVDEAERWLPDAGADLPGGLLHDASLHTVQAGLTPGGKLPSARRILLADDNADMRDYVRRLLTQKGYQVEAVGDGEAAFRAALRHKPDLVLSDIMMPRLDGFGLLRELRGDAALGDIPVILLSARAGEESRIEGMQAGADDYLIKPFSARELLARLEAHLKMAQLRRESMEALRYRTAQFETLLNQVPVGVYLVDSDFRIREVNPVALPVFGDIPGGILDRDFDEIIHILWHQEYADELVRRFRHTLETGEAYTESERAESRADRGVTEHYEWRLDRILLPDGRFGLVCCFRDVSQRVQADNTRQLLLGELNHRVKNTLASVQAIAQQTLRTTRDPADFAARFSGRIQSLARVHALLTEATWQGADLRELIRDQVLQGPVDETRLTGWGPVVHLQPQLAVHLALMLHELGTNSVKYGALSVPQGRVSISWAVKDNALALDWIERGGPLVAAPVARGFGTTLIERSAKSEGGSAEMICEASGVTWKLMLPLPEVSMQPGLKREAEMGDARIQPGAKGATEPAVLGGIRMLVIEDEPLIAMDIVDRLEKAGADVEDAVGTEDEALQTIAGGRFDMAVLDANLHGRPVGEIAAALTRHKKPFAFVTGYGDANLPESFEHVPVVAKPFSDEQLLEVLMKIAPRPAEVTPFKPATRRQA